MNPKLIRKLNEKASELKSKPKASYIHLSNQYIQKLANKYQVSFNRMVNILKNFFKP